jgi:phosphoesterase RecJ-like protein
MLEAEGVTMEDTEGAIDLIRNINGVEIAAFLKENGPETIKASMRAKTYGNVAEIAGKFGGGGHIKAAGCTFHTDLESARTQLKTAIEESLRD